MSFSPAPNIPSLEHIDALATASFSVETADVESLLQNELNVIVDLRDPEEFEKGSLPRAINIPAKKLKCAEDIAALRRDGLLPAANDHRSETRPLNAVIVYGAHNAPESSAAALEALKACGMDARDIGDYETVLDSLQRQVVPLFTPVDVSPIPGSPTLTRNPSVLLCPNCDGHKAPERDLNKWWKKVRTLLASPVSETAPAMCDMVARYLMRQNCGSSGAAGNIAGMSILVSEYAEGGTPNLPLPQPLAKAFLMINCPPFTNAAVHTNKLLSAVEAQHRPVVPAKACPAGYVMETILTDGFVRLQGQKVSQAEIEALRLIEKEYLAAWEYVRKLLRFFGGQCLCEGVQPGHRLDSGFLRKASTNSLLVALELELTSKMHYHNGFPMINPETWELVPPVGGLLSRPAIFPHTFVASTLQLIYSTVIGHTPRHQIHEYYHVRKNRNGRALAQLQRLTESGILQTPPVGFALEGCAESPIDLRILRATATAALLYTALLAASVGMSGHSDDGACVLPPPFARDEDERDTVVGCESYTCKPFHPSLVRNKLPASMHYLMTSLLEFDDSLKVQPKTIMFVAGLSGDILYDLRVCEHIAEMGHRVILMVNSVEVVDLVNVMDFKYDDSFLAHFHDRPDREIITADKALLHRHIYSNRLSLVVMAWNKPEFLPHVDPFMACPNFFRACRMSELIIARDIHRYTLESMNLERDVFFLGAADGVPRLTVKPRHGKTALITRRYILAKANRFIAFLRRVKKKGMSVVFGSCIIGSLGDANVPTTKAIAAFQQKHFHRTDCYNKYLRGVPASKLYYINPASGYVDDADKQWYPHFERGFDGDGMMEYWTMIQESGLINVWYFQSRFDIIRYFESLSEEERPPFWEQMWASKDWTQSKGCMQEMIIARRVKRIFPELVIACDDADTLQLTDDEIEKGCLYGIGRID